MQEEIASTAVETVFLSGELGQFEIEPLISGFGLTLGNALRRVLLSSLTGAAITAIKIENVYHEFSSIPGVREDTTELILNLKQVRLKSYTDDAVSVRLESSGPGVVTAGDIQVPPEIEIVNPEVTLATLDNADTRLEMMLTIEKGRGYLTGDGREAPSIGVIPIDAVFTPIRRVNYRVEKTRVGARTDYDKLILEIQTDGSIGPKEALAQAAQILIDHFQIFAQLSGTVQRVEKASIGPGAIPSRLQDMPIEVLDLSSRTYNCLKRSQITTVGQLLQMSEDELLGLRNFGQKSLQELHEKLARHGIVTTADGEAGPSEYDEEEEVEEDEERYARVRGYREYSDEDDEGEEDER
ncbi:MAG TPA: DNA-directed RNA polymerase subunit alpha [Chloroflexota bacterium]|nr:DNA-directed RNA polymerase subunit alpha [Chloroflexota bacterium]